MIRKKKKLQNLWTCESHLQGTCPPVSARSSSVQEGTLTVKSHLLPQIVKAEPQACRMQTIFCFPTLLQLPSHLPSGWFPWPSGASPEAILSSRQNSLLFLINNFKFCRALPLSYNLWTICEQFKDTPRPLENCWDGHESPPSPVVLPWVLVREPTVLLEVYVPQVLQTF